MSEKHPVIVCLCGSSRFRKAFEQANEQETLAGNIVLTIGCDTKRSATFQQLSDEEQQRTKEQLDWLHWQKIALADEVLVINVNYYVGASTAREISFAASKGKLIRWWWQW